MSEKVSNLQTAHIGRGISLTVLRSCALALITGLVLAAVAVSFAESYRGLYEWSSRHGLAGAWAAIWPLQVDVFIAVGELALVVGLADGWTVRQRAGAWTVALLGLAVSVAGNVGHAAGHDWTNRGTAAIPPLAAAAALAVGLGVLKRVVAGQAEPVAIAGPIAGEAQSWERRDRSAPRHTRHSPQRRRSSTQPVRRSAVEWDAAALPVLATEPLGRL